MVSEIQTEINRNKPTLIAFECPHLFVFDERISNQGDDFHSIYPEFLRNFPLKPFDPFLIYIESSY